MSEFTEGYVFVTKNFDFTRAFTCKLTKFKLFVVEDINIIISYQTVSHVADCEWNKFILV